MQPAVNTTQQYGRSGYGSSFNGSRPGQSYGGSQQAYRAPEAASFQRNDFAQRSAPANFGGKSFAGSSIKAPHEGGFHPFGGGHSEKSFGGGGKSFSGGGKASVAAAKASVAATPAEAGITSSASITKELYFLHISSHIGAAFLRECRVSLLSWLQST